MTRHLVLCLMFAIAAGLTAATAAAFSGLGWLAGLAVYSATGSIALVTSTVAAHAITLRPVPVPAPRSTKGRAEPERALA